MGLIMNKRKNIIFKILERTLFVVLLIIILNILVNKSDKLFDIVGFRTYTVLSGSMEPEFYPGDLLLIKNKNKTDINLNDIITFKDKDGTIVTHRIIAFDEKGFVTKGDNNNVEDLGIVKNTDIIGKLQCNIPNLGYVVNFFASPMFLSFSLISLAIVVILTEFNK